ncbi:MAG: cbb3-type cytochrome c oxidase subunit I [Gammaproteobacteria bacterium]|nr:cbb3-type cytochrome c oxidase subunit I [Gammaproteobacteria bacterium]NNF61267.1 cytochrome C oxidase subunit I [Gammaproteobacteria bacterium]NNM21701.1 cytochrome C oxidase subunit I [Gammaproteobacteria bacterium]
MNTEQFRICPESGLQFHKPAETLMRLHAVIAIVILLVGGITALLVTLTRWPAVHLMPADRFYQLLTLHGVNMLIFWIITFEIAILYFCSSTLLRCRLATPRIAWFGLALMVIGIIVNNMAVLKGDASVMMTSYVPMPANPNFYLGLILFAVGALLGCFIFLGTLVIAKEEKTYEGSIPLVTFGALTACIIAVFTIASGAIILIPTYMWSMGWIGHIDAAMYRLIWWALGHSSQQINVAAHVAVWYAIAAIVFGAKPLSEKVSRMAFLLYIAFLQLASAHHLLVDPGLSASWKIFNTSYAMYLAVLASMVHGLTVPGSIEVAQRAKGFSQGLFQWLRKAPWGNPVFSGMFISLLGFGFLGGISGVVMGTEQINIIIHNTIYVPGHFHATVVIGTTLAFMSLTYFLIPVLFRRQLVMPGLARWQPYLFGIGMGVFTTVMMGAGTLGVARRHWDMAFTDSALGFDYPASAYTLMGLVGISGMVAILGGAIFILVTVLSVFFGKPVESESPYGVTATVLPRAEPTIEPAGGHAATGKWGFAAPGTFVFAIFFLAIFVVYYAVNWKYLASVWPLQ